MRASLVYAGRLERLLAYLIDTIILVVPAMYFASILHGDAIATPLCFLASMAYYTYFTASRWQATPGKRLLGIYIIRTDNRMLTYRDGAERFLAFMLPSLPMYASFIPANVAPGLSLTLSIVWFASILYTEERVGLHDRICHTRVLIGRVG
jgi:uncharacterized RDD family membrane protein YckC